LQKETGRQNGAGDISLSLLDDEPEPGPIPMPPIKAAAEATVDQAIRIARRDQKIASIWLMMLDAAKMIDPIAEIVNDKALRWATLGSAVWLTHFALRDPSWQRVAVLGVFCILAPWLTKGRKR
jgi:hypothetical protein